MKAEEKAKLATPGDQDATAAQKQPVAESPALVSKKQTKKDAKGKAKEIVANDDGMQVDAQAVSTEDKVSADAKATTDKKGKGKAKAKEMAVRLRRVF